MSVLPFIQWLEGKALGQPQRIDPYNFDDLDNWLNQHVTSGDISPEEHDAFVKWHDSQGYKIPIARVMANLEKVVYQRQKDLSGNYRKVEPRVTYSGGPVLGSGRVVRNYPKSGFSSVHAN